MFQVISIVALVAVAGACLVHLAAWRGRNRIAAGPRTVRRYTVWERLVHLAVMGSFLVQAVTGFWPALQGLPLRGWLLMIHVSFGGVFAVSLALMALRWAHDCRFAACDRQWRCWAALRGGELPPAGKFDACQKALFWLSLLLGLSATLAMMLSMVPLFGPEGLDWLLEVHRYSALGLLAAIVVHSYMQTLGRPGTWQVLLTGRVSQEWAWRYHRLWWEENRGP